MKLVIRLATKSDYDQVGLVFSEENRHHAELVPEVIQVAEPIMTPAWYDRVLADPLKVLFVAEMESEIVGLVLAEQRTSVDDPIYRRRRTLYVGEIAVPAEHRVRGIGRRLMERVHQWGREQGISEVELQLWERNQEAIRFYESLGYRNWRRTMRHEMDG